MYIMSSLYQKYIITKTDGSPVDPEAKHPAPRTDTDRAAQEAPRTYTTGTKEKEPEPAKQPPNRPQRTRTSKCTCTSNCNHPCKGNCGCEQCKQDWNDFLSLE